MKPLLVALGFALLTFRWWWALWTVLRADLEQASEPEGVGAGPQSLEHFPFTSRHFDRASRIPPNRLLAFRGVERRIERRRRWEAGFGRRGL